VSEKEPKGLKMSLNEIVDGWFLTTKASSRSCRHYLPTYTARREPATLPTADSARQGSVATGRANTGSPFG